MIRTKHIGIVACSAEGAALCYRTLCLEAGDFLGEYLHPEVSMHTHPLGEYMAPIRSGDWKSVAELMLDSAHKLAAAGAHFIICPDNTIHQAFDLVAASSPLPWVHIAEPVATEARKRNFHKIAITGTKYLMTSPVYPQVFDQYGLKFEIPTAEERDVIDDIIFKELVNGIVTESARKRFNVVVSKMKAKGCDAVVLGCTELPILVGPNDYCPLPTLDSTRLLARAAIIKAIQEE